MTQSSRLVLGKTLAVVVAALMLALSAAVPASANPSHGLNDWTCRPSPAHPRPVVLLHGAMTNATMSWPVIGPQLAANGYCVFAPTYGGRLPVVPVGGIDFVEKSAWEISAYLDRVFEATQAEKVDLVGHSLGGFEAVFIPKFIPGKAKRIGHVVSLGAPIHGTDYSRALRLEEALLLRPPADFVNKELICAPCVQLEDGGDSVDQLETGRITRPGIDYTMIATQHDEAATPPDIAFITEPGVKNIYVQHYCPSDLSGHLGLLDNSAVNGLILRALDPGHKRRIACGLSIPG
ncbi:esterase/lipase family protein [Actinomadura fibrosa]|uniref:Esterase/lipase family protein n=1 Tax=Actinomadura fibrosa TaxID=111802 RepID=A0ABW2XFX2_9ACTN|nr:alpha/beta fold hydrolase [Actinomadura fibrosa]